MEQNDVGMPGGALDERNRQRIALLLGLDGAQQLGRAAGLNSAEMEANRRGTSHDAKGTACLRFVQALLRGSAAGRDFERMAAAGFRPPQTAEVVALVRAAMIDSRREMVNCGQTSSPHSPAV